MIKTLMLTTALVAAGFAVNAQDAAPTGAASKDIKTVVPGAYELDSSHASVEWKVWHMGYSNFAGRFDKITGSATVSPDLTKSGVVVNIAADSGNTGVQKLDDELDQKEFFDAEKYPAITFTSTKIEQTGTTTDGKPKGKVYGMLSLRGVTKPVVLDAVFNGHGPSPMNQQERMGFNATGKIKRSDYGFNHLVPMVSDEVELDIAVEFAKK